MPLLDDALILDHASGAAAPALSVLAACHAELNREAGARMGAVESAFGALLERGETAGLQPGAFERVIGAVERIEAGERARAAAPAAPTGLPDALARAARTDLKRGLAWRRCCPGLSEIRLPSLDGAGAQARLLRLDGGRAAPRHDHDGEEVTLVLAGGFLDEHGHYDAGDVCAAAPGLSHQPRVPEGEACVCLAVNWGRWRFANPFLAAADRFVQTFLR